MKAIFRLMAMAMLVFFMSACGGSSGGGDTDNYNDGDYTEQDYINDTDGTSNPIVVENAVQSGQFSTSFNGAAEKTWYTSQVRSPENYIVNTAIYTSGENYDSVLVGAASSVGTTNSDGDLLFTLYFPSKVTTGDLILGQVQYRDNQNTEMYGYLQNMIGSDIIANITEATNTNDVLHIKGSFSGTLYDGLDDQGNPQDPQSISVSFEFDAHRTDIQY